MRKMLGASLLVPVAFTATGQKCVHTKLSETLTFKVEARRLPRMNREKGGYADSTIVRITVVAKTTREPVYTVRYFSNFLYSPAFSQCKAVRSYTTGFRQNAPVVDFDYGDLVVADFDFDGREDFAARVDDGNTGPSYNYYLQNKAGTFTLSNFLTHRMGHFPTSIVKSAHTLLWETNDGRWYYKISYRLNTATHRWRRIEHEAENRATGPIQYEAD